MANISTSRGQDCINGEINSGDVRTSVSNVNQWQEKVLQEWNTLQGIQLSLETIQLKFRIWGEIDSETLIIETNAQGKDEINEVV